MFTIYTDGSYRNGRRNECGGAGVIIYHNESKEVIHKKGYTLSGDTSHMTSQRAELESIALALEHMIEFNLQDERIVLYSDSKYSIHSVNKWIASWMKNGWISKMSGKPVLNKDLMERLWNLKIQFSNLELKWVKGHNGNKWNEEADFLARTANAVGRTGKVIPETEFVHVVVPQVSQAKDEKMITLLDSMKKFQPEGRAVFFWSSIVNQLESGKILSEKQIYWAVEMCRKNGISTSIEPTWKPDPNEKKETKPKTMLRKNPNQTEMSISI